MHHYVYIITNQLNGKQYVGDHSTNNLEDGYLGSGVLLLRAKKKYGKENFSREILEHFNTKQEAFDAQAKYINKFNTLKPNGYNLDPLGGHGTWGGYLSEESRKKISKSLSKSIKGRKLSEEHKKKLSEAKKGKKLSEEHRKKLSEAAKKRPSNRKGQHHSEKTKQKLSKLNKGRKHSEETKQKFKNRIPWNKGLKYSN